MRERLERERGITGASTYTDRAVAEHAVGAAIAESQDRIERWLSRSGGHPNLVLDYDSATPIGRTINRSSVNRGESQSRPCAHALVVLKYVWAQRLLCFDFLSGVPLMNLETGNHRRQLPRPAYVPAGLLS